MDSKIIIGFIFLVIFILLFSGYVVSPTIADISPQPIETETILSKISKEENNKKPKIFIVTVTGYSSSYDETDDDPYITASGDLVHPGVVATNFLPFGTKIKIPKLFGDKIFIVKDRMHERFYYRIDVWFPSKEEALEFGVHYNVPIEIVD